MSGFSQKRYLQQQQLQCTTRQLYNQSVVRLNENSIQELVTWVNNLEISSGKLILSPIKQNYSSVRRFTGSFENIFPENVCRGSMHTSRVNVIRQSVRT